MQLEGSADKKQLQGMGKEKHHKAIKSMSELWWSYPQGEASQYSVLFRGLSAKSLSKKKERVLIAIGIIVFMVVFLVCMGMAALYFGMMAVSPAYSFFPLVGSILMAVVNYSILKSLIEKL